MTEQPTPRTEAGRCPECGGHFNPNGLATHIGMKHRESRLGIRLQEAWADGYANGKRDGEAQARTEALDDCDEVRRLLRYLWTATGRSGDDPVYSLFDPDDPIVADIDRLAAKETPDTASDYGRLLAERDRLIGESVDPADLLVPEPPGEEAP